LNTIHDVARLAGVSIATVSAVVNKKGRVSPELTRRVQKALQALDYQPHRLARSLKVQRTSTVGIVIPDVTNLFFAEVVRGVENEARGYGYSIILCDSNDDRQQELTNLDTLYSWRVDGVLLAPADGQAGYDRLDRRRFPVVFLDRIPPGYTGPAVTTDNFDGAYQATRHLITLGHTRLATIVGRLDLSNARDRLEGFRKALQEAGLPLHDQYLQEGDFQLASGYRCGLHLLRLPTPPTAIFSCSNKMTLGLMSAVNELGIRCPEEVSILGFDDFDWAAYFSPRLTTVAQPTHEIGKQAMRMLIREIQEAGRPETNGQSGIVVLKPELIIRDSTAIPSQTGRFDERRAIVTGG
jgi:LacI family transcriptional regulator, galactose operon repressor